MALRSGSPVFVRAPPDVPDNLMYKRKVKQTVGTAYPRAFQAVVKNGAKDVITLPLFEASLHALPQLYVHATVSVFNQGYDSFHVFGAVLSPLPRLIAR